MQNLCPNQDKAVCFNRNCLIFNLHIPGTAFDKKNLRKLVAVREAGPVIFIF